MAFNKIFKIILYVLVALIPLWFLPISQDAVVFQKQVLLVVLVLAAAALWLAEIVNKREVSLRISWLHIPVAFLVLATLASSLLSVWMYGSFWGWPLSVTDSFITLFFFVLLYALISTTAKDSKEMFTLFFVALASSAVAGIYAVLQLFQWYVIPLSFTHSSTFNTVGSANSIAVLSAVLLPLALTMTFISKAWQRIACWVIAVALFLVILTINFFYAWVVLAAGLAFLLVFGIWNLKKKMDFGWVSFPMVLLVIALFFLVLRVAVPGLPSSPIEVSPSQATEINMLKEVLQKNVFFGTGPGTFMFDYTKYHNTNVNQTIFWATRFASGASGVLDWFIAKGVVGGALFIILMITALVLACRALIVSKLDNTSWTMLLGLSASFLAISVASFVYYSNFVLLFAFWLLLGGVAFYAANWQKKLAIIPSSPFAVISSFVFLLVLVFGAGFLFIGGQKYIAEVQYSYGLKQIASGQQQKGIDKVLSAASLNPSVDLYWRDLAQLYLSQVNQIATDTTLPSSQRAQLLQVAVGNAATAANQATIVSSLNVENWNVRGYVYRSLIGFQGAEAMAVESYTTANTLEPSSPFALTELGRVYLAQAQSLDAQKDAPPGTEAKKREALTKALENLEKAIVLKGDYAPAHYLVAMVYGEQGRADEQIAKLEKTELIAPSDVGLMLQLGVLYYQNNQTTKAQQEFEKIKARDPNYANGRYMLGLVYDKIGETDKAIEEFRKVVELNPSNDQAKAILANLVAGRAALSGIAQSQSLPQENPPEIQNKTK